jgi:hypothetical protein
MSLVAWIAWVAISIWLLVTLVAQHTGLGSRLARYDAVRLIPRWTFFAPNPGVKDYHLVVRDQTSNLVLSEWKTVTFGPDRRWFNLLWHPHKRARKILSDAVQSLRIVSSHGPNGLLSDSLSLPYLLLLKYSFEQCALADPFIARQFAIVESSGHDVRRLEIAYASLFHPA